MLPGQDCVHTWLTLSLAPAIAQLRLQSPAFLWELGCWFMDLLSPLSLLYQPQSLLGQPSQDVVACDAVPASQDSPPLLGGFLGEEPQLRLAGHPPSLNHWEFFCSTAWVLLPVLFCKSLGSLRPVFTFSGPLLSEA